MAEGPGDRACGTAYRCPPLVAERSMATRRPTSDVVWGKDHTAGAEAAAGGRPERLRLRF